MTNATENVIGDDSRVVKAWPMQDRINDLRERANAALETAREYREKACGLISETDSYAYLNCKKQESFYMGKYSAWALAADNLQEFLQDSILSARHDAERAAGTRSLSPSTRQSIVREIMEHEEQCELPCSEEALNKIEATLLNATDDFLIAEYKNYFPGSVINGLAS